MFKKKPNIKPLAPLRSSDRRKIADQIIKDLELPISNEDSQNAEEKAAAVQARSSLRNHLLPDNALSGTIYVGSHEGEEQRVLWVGLEGQMYPTVYTLWRNPGIIPLIHTASHVIERMQAGADLMTPGLINGPPFPEKAKKGAIVAIAGHESPSVPLAVGTCVIDISALQEVRGVKGHAVETFHCSGDEIWSWHASGKPGGAPPADLDGWQKGRSNSEELAEDVGNLMVEDQEEEGGVSLEASVEDSAADTNGAEDEQEPAREFSTAEIDEAFKNAFLYGVHQFKSANPKTKNHGLDFPLTPTFIMSILVNPFLPAFTPQEAAQLQIKKSSWKNIKKFIKHLDKQRIVRSKDQNGGETVILDIDFDDPSIQAFKPYRLPKKETISAGPSNETTSGDGDSIGQKLQISTLYKPRDRLFELFETTKSSTKEFYSAPDVKTIVATYIEVEALVPPNNKRVVNLNPYLAHSIFDSSRGALDKEIIAKGFCPRETLSTRVLDLCAPFYHIVRHPVPANTTSTSDRKPTPGLPPKITIILETRSGNKSITRVSNLEPYYINPHELADELKKACAGATSVERLQGSSPKNPVMEVMVQGPQEGAVVKALGRRGVERRWVEVLDKTKKGKGR